jgi:hypothetical protein
MKGKFIKYGVILGLLLVMLASLVPTGVMADYGPWGGINIQPKDMTWAALYQKDSTTWLPIPNGGRGLLMYDNKGSNFCFMFNADKLAPSTNYSLIYYADQPDRFTFWGGNYPGAFIAAGNSDSKGVICLKGSVNLGMNLPALPDNNVSVNQPTGAKVWLVLSSDYDKNACKMTAWQPTKYLLDDSSRLVQYTDTDVLSTQLVQKDGSFNPIVTGPFGWLWYTPKGHTFGYKFNGYGLTPGTSYSLIYYADPYPGNNPGALIATGTTDANGFLNIPVGSIALNKNLPIPPDTNTTGAKIWLVLSSEYNASTHSVIGWDQPNILMETNLIKYTYTH